MSDNKQQKVHPDIWKQIVANHQQYKFTQRMIFKKDGVWTWQTGKDTQIDISNWLFHWKVNGETKLMTMDEINL
jgi:hypothetical protein